MVGQCMEGQALLHLLLLFFFLLCIFLALHRPCRFSGSPFFPARLWRSCSRSLDTRCLSLCQAPHSLVFASVSLFIFLFGFLHLHRFRVSHRFVEFLGRIHPVHAGLLSAGECLAYHSTHSMIESMFESRLTGENLQKHINFPTDAYCKDKLLQSQRNENKLGTRIAVNGTVESSQGECSKSRLKTNIESKGFAEREASAQVQKPHRDAKVSPVSPLKSEQLAKACECEDVLKNTNAGVAGPEILSETATCANKISREAPQNGLQCKPGAGEVHTSVQEGVHEMINQIQKIFESSLANKRAEQERARTQRGSMVSRRQHESENLDGSQNKEQIGCVQGASGEKVGVCQEGRGTGDGLEEVNVGQRESNPEFFNLMTNDVPGLGTKRPSATRKELPDVIVIDDDEDGEVENHNTSDELRDYDEDSDSDAGSKKIPSSYVRGWQGSDDSSAAASELSDSSDDEDCFVMEPGPSRMSWHLHRRVHRAEKRPAYNLYKSREYRSSGSNSSDCEIIEDPHGKIRQDWEEAALRKRVENAINFGRYRADSEGSTSASIHANSAAKPSANRKRKGPAQQHEVKEQEQSKNFQSGSAIPVTSAGSKYSKEREEIPVALDQQDSNLECSQARSGGATNLAGEEALPSENTSISSGNDAMSLDERASEFHSNTAPVGTSMGELFFSESSQPQEGCDAAQISGRLDVDHVSETRVAEAVMDPTPQDLILERERLKETEEFRHADEEEWARRQLELQRQAQEAQRQRKRRKVETERRMEMESRQRQRLEEIRRSQQKEEQNLDYKEQVRGRIRSELERSAASCIDMATLLRRLGVQVDGGALPTTQQVNAAYKKALLRFHPDRVAALAKSDPLRQVEAEETFKLISRMKSTLQPVSIRYFS